MRSYDLHWKDDRNWYEWNKENECFEIKKDAPEEAQKSYKHYMEQVRDASEKYKRGIIV